MKPDEGFSKGTTGEDEKDGLGGPAYELTRKKKKKKKTRVE